MVMKSTTSSSANRDSCVLIRLGVTIILLQINIIGILSQGTVGNRCTLTDGRQGICVETAKCNTALSRGSNRGNCNYSYYNIIVCCVFDEAPPSRFNNNNNNNNYNNNNPLRVQGQSQEDYVIDDAIENIFNQNPEYDVSYEQTNPRQSGQPWWMQNNRPFSTTTDNPVPWYNRKTTTTTTTTRRPFVNRPVATRPSIKPGNNDGSIWGIEDRTSNNRPTTNRPTTSRPFTSRPATSRPATSRPATSRPSRPINNRPATSTPFRPTNRPTQQGKSISEQKCIEYSRAVSTSVGALPLLPNAEPVIISVAKCDYNSVPLIVGGTQTLPGEFPHMAAVGYRSNGKIDWDCGGSLISDFFVMTAAHCTTAQKGPPFMVRLGELDLKKDNDGADPKNYRVLQVITHHQYKPPARYNDIALLRLAEKVTFTKHIRPACLYTKSTFDVGKAMATGWGKIDFAENPSDILLKVSLNIIDSDLCNSRYASENSDRLQDGIVPTMLCAGDLKGGRDTCQGDSGGPIQITSRDNQCIFHVIGITSFGKFCAAINTPGVYTRVSSFIPWIESVVWP